MIVNTGISLRKPGESLYTRFRRYLIANQGIYTNYSSSRNALIKFGESKFGKSMGGLSSIEVLTRIEEEIIESNLLDKYQRINPASFHPRSIKNCEECAKIGFHSEIYNLVWVTKCPIHKVDLTSRCGKCDQIWPSVGNLFNTNCDVCGVRISFTLLSERRAFDIKKEFDVFNDILKFNSQALNSERYSIKEYFGTYSENINDCKSTQVNLHSRFTPSAVLTRTSEKRWTKEVLSAQGMLIYDATTLSFPTSKVDSDIKESITTHERLKILYRVKTRILNVINESHRSRGEKNGCCNNSNPYNSDLCPACKAWYYFNGAELWQSEEIEKTNLNHQILHVFWQIESQLISRKFLPRPVYPNNRLSRHIEFENISQPGSDGVKTIRIPLHVLKWMYYSELLIFYLHSYLQFLYLEECEHTALIDICAFSPKSLKPDGLLSNPYYINASKELVSITIPKFLLQPRLALSHELMVS